MKRRSAVAAAVIALAGTANAQVPGAETQGVWRSHGYGYIVRIDAAGSKLFHAVDGDCYADPRPDPDPDGVLAAPRTVSPDVIAFASGSAYTGYLFDRLPALPAACLAKIDWTPRRVAAVAAETFAAFYPSSPERPIDWRARARIADKAAQTATAQAQQLIASLLGAQPSGSPSPSVTASPSPSPSG